MKLYIDFDSTLVDSITRACEMYTHFHGHDRGFRLPKPHLLQKYNFVDQCPLLRERELEEYFSSESFFDYLLPIEPIERVIELNKIIPVIIVTLGTHSNISFKAKYIEENYRNLKAIYISHTFNDTSDKSFIDMSDGILLDDNISNLLTSNAMENYVYGPEREYNKTNKFKRIHNLLELREEIYAKICR